jgi:HlyD family secretion protein
VTGLVDATEIDVASKVPGRVKEVFVREGQKVEAGAKLVSIESDEISAKIDQVNAAVSGAEAKLRMAQSGARQEERDTARQAVESAKHQVELAKKTYDRVEALRSSGAVAEASFDEADARYKLAKDQLDMAQSRYGLVMRGARTEEIQALSSLVAQSKANLAEVQSYQKETSQTAPIAGEVTKIVLHRGELAATGYPIVTLVDMNDLWASFAVREDMLARVRQGNRITVEIPALGRTAEMQIEAISAMGDFATWRATSEKNSFDLKSFEVKARPVGAIEGIRPGMTVRWTVE